MVDAYGKDGQLALALVQPSAKNDTEEAPLPEVGAFSRCLYLAILGYHCRLSFFVVLPETTGFKVVGVSEACFPSVREVLSSFATTGSGKARTSAVRFERGGRQPADGASWKRPTVSTSKPTSLCSAVVRRHA